MYFMWQHLNSFYDIISGPIEIARLIKGSFDYMHVPFTVTMFSRLFYTNGILFKIAKLLYKINTIVVILFMSKSQFLLWKIET